MATIIGTFYRNYNSSDITYQTASIGTSAPYPSPFWDPPEEYIFKEWNTSRDGTGTSYQPGDSFIYGNDTFYAIWKLAPVYKLIDITNFNLALTATANAIRTKINSADSIEWDMDSGFADIITDIQPSTGNYQSAIGVSFGSNLIYFTIDNVTYSAIPNQTWSEWLESNLNPLNIYGEKTFYENEWYNGISCTYKYDNYTLEINNDKVYPNNIILSQETYTWHNEDD